MQEFPIAVRTSKKRCGNLIEALEIRAYLAGVVFGPAQNTSAATANVAPIYAILDNVFSTTHADLVVSSAASGGVGNSVSVLPGNGDGTFGTAHTVALDFSPLTIADAQLGTNGKEDIVVGSTSNNKVGVILQASDGSLSETDYAATGLSDTQSLAIGDFNNDGHPDFAVASDDAGTSSNVAIFLNNGDGTFTLHQVVSVPHSHIASLINFNGGSGHVDLAVADQDSNAVTTILNDGSGNFSVGTDYAVGSGPVTIKSGTFNLNGNGNDDLVTANSTGGSVSVLLGNGDGTFNPTAVTTAVSGVPGGGGPLKIRVSNLTNSGKPDLLALLPAGSSGDAEVLLGQGDGTFHVGNIISTGGSTRNAIAGGDLNGDGLTDLVLVNTSTITALLNETNQDTGAPSGAVDISQPTQTAGSATITFTVTYTDARQIDTTTLGNGNLTVTEPGGATVAATLVSSNLPNAASVTVTYSIPAPSGALSASDDGNYTVTATSTSSQAVQNANGVSLPGGQIGTFTVQVSVNQNGPNLTAVSLTGKLPTSVVAGSKNKGGVIVTIKNTGTQAAKGKIVVNLYASTNTSLPGNAPLLGTATVNVNLKPGKSQKINISKITWASTLNGRYFLIADVDATKTIAETTFTDNFAVSASSVLVAPPFVDLDNVWNGTLPKIASGKKVTFLIPVKNTGNVTAKGKVTITIQASTTGSASGAQAIGAPLVSVNTPPGKTQKLAAHVTIPALASGSYRVLVTVGSLSSDTDTADKTVVSGGSFTI
ncbi:MAG TPA: FG-GAP-like repeat-containing protein [Tepidisphaeraceae bacterium]|jgi:hypothetical protein|nr:FG-GAP-like repeat-containing protein [Tepidisphaeraceae bacterium]